MRNQEPQEAQDPQPISSFLPFAIVQKMSANMIESTQQKEIPEGSALSTDTAASDSVLERVRQAEEYLDTLYSIYTINKNNIAKTPGSNKREDPSPSKRQASTVALMGTTHSQMPVWTWILATASNTPSANIRNVIYFPRVTNR
ncbi:hypothetical protein ABVK25_012271 [Lepraria finkii]|uniref:Uncharacterized protein n=1 Tax=Lepraria finkii TaxID=1340010 RepID=A0ABR4AFP0_9LECA